jgi:hypothetical protein
MSNPISLNLGFCHWLQQNIESQQKTAQAYSKGVFCTDDSNAHHTERFEKNKHAKYRRFSSRGHRPEDRTERLLVRVFNGLDGVYFEGCRLFVYQRGFRDF